MGIKDFVKVFASVGTATYKDYKDEPLAVDSFIELFRSGSMQHAAKLTNPQGEPTLHLRTVFSNATKRKSLGGRDVWCFDSRDPRDVNDPKTKTLEARAQIRRTNLDEIAALATEIERLESMAAKTSKEKLAKIDPTFDITLVAKRDQLEMLKARNPEAQHFSSRIRDVQFILSKLGVAMVIAPPGCDAEKLATHLQRDGVVKGVISTDTDCIAYGSRTMLKKISGKSGRYDVYTLKACMKQHSLTYRQLVQVCVALGCDFADKVEGVGPKTVVNKVKQKLITWTPEQRAAIKKFMNRESVEYETIESECTDESLDELTEWLVTTQGFKRETVEKTLQPFYSA